MTQQSTFTKITFGIGLIFLVYGFLSKIIPIYFFWESKTIGWTFIFIGLIGFLSNGIKKRKLLNKKTVWNKIGIGFICFTFFIQLLLIIIIPNTDAYTISKEYIKNNNEIKSELGEIIGFGLIPTGSISVKTDLNGKAGDAILNFIVKGKKAYKNITVFSSKGYNTEWKVYNIQ